MHQTSLLITEVLLLAIPFRLLGVVPSILFPVIRVRLAPLARTL